MPISMIREIYASGYIQRASSARCLFETGVDKYGEAVRRLSKRKEHAKERDTNLYLRLAQYLEI